jgi:hypothetical protein
LPSDVINIPPEFILLTETWSSGSDQRIDPRLSALCLKSQNPSTKLQINNKFKILNGFKETVFCLGFRISVIVIYLVFDICELGFPHKKGFPLRFNRIAASGGLARFWKSYPG